MLCATVRLFDLDVFGDGGVKGNFAKALSNGGDSIACNICVVEECTDNAKNVCVCIQMLLDFGNGLFQSNDAAQAKEAAINWNDDVLGGS